MTAVTAGTGRPPIASVIFGLLGVVCLFSLFSTWFTSDNRGSVSGVGYASGQVSLVAILVCLATFIAAVFISNKRQRSWLLIASLGAHLVFICSVGFALLSFAWTYAVDGSLDDATQNPSMTRLAFVVFGLSIIALVANMFGANEIDPLPTDPRRRRRRHRRQPRQPATR